MSAKEGSAKASQAAVELERAVSRQSSNEERIAKDLTQPGQVAAHRGLTAPRSNRRPRQVPFPVEDVEEAEQLELGSIIHQVDDSYDERCIG